MWPVEDAQRDFDCQIRKIPRWSSGGRWKRQPAFHYLSSFQVPRYSNATELLGSQALSLKILKSFVIVLRFSDIFSTSLSSPGPPTLKLRRSAWNIVLAIMKILALHGLGSSGAMMKAQLAPFIKAFGAGYQFVFIDGAIPCGRGPGKRTHQDTAMPSPSNFPKPCQPGKQGRFSRSPRVSVHKKCGRRFIA